MRTGEQQMLTRGKPGPYTDHREALSLCDLEAARKSLILTDNEVRHIIHIRMIGFGDAKITIIQGEPVQLEDVRRVIDYRKLTQ